MCMDLDSLFFLTFCVLLYCVFGFDIVALDWSGILINTKTRYKESI